MIFKFKNTSRLNAEELINTMAPLTVYASHLLDVISSKNYHDLECSLNLPSDMELPSQVSEMVAKKTSPNLKYIFVIGIGGSNLGTKAIYDAMFGFFDVIESKRFPKIIFLDTQDETVLSKLEGIINGLENKNEFLINVISKSGGTTETMANLEYLSSTLSKKFGNIYDRIVFTTDEGSKMHQKARELAIDSLTIPKNVGGRFSVFSAVGLFPLALVGINIEKLRTGAVKMRDICGKSMGLENPAMVSASILHLSSRRGLNINDNFIFIPQLESLGKWYRQLMGESIGKDGKGITPTVSIGSTDLHSVGQLYLGGPKDKITTFVSQFSREDTKLADSLEFGLVESIQSKSIGQIMDAIVNGTKIAYANQGLPYMEIEFEKISEEEIGELMQFKMMEMMYLGKLLGVNTFDQPHVELYKQETKKILEEI